MQSNTACQLCMAIKPIIHPPVFYLEHTLVRLYGALYVCARDALCLHGREERDALCIHGREVWSEREVWGERAL